MKLLLFFLSLIFPCASGAVIIGYSGAFREKKYPVLSLVTGLLIGLGISSIMLFLWLLVYGKVSNYYIAFESILLIFLFFLLKKNWQKFMTSQPGALPAQNETGQEAEANRILTPSRVKLIFIYLVFFHAIFLLMGAFKLPQGYWDAWAIWNLRARMIFLSGDAWESAFSDTYGDSHPDYPLMLPLTITRSWIFTGESTAIVPAGFSIFAALATTIFLFYAVERLRGRYTALTAVLLLMGTPFFLKFGCWQYSDQLLGLFFLVTCYFLIAGTQKGQEKLMFIAGLSAGFAAWTKNEGLVFALLTLLYLIMSFWLQSEKLAREAWKSKFLPFCTGIAPGILTLILFKSVFPVRNDILAAVSNHSFSIFFDFARHAKILKHMWSSLFIQAEEKVFYPHMPLPILIACYFLFSRRKNSLLSTWLLTIIPAGMLLSYAAAYLFSPHALEWHIEKSFNRLFMQQWPIILFLFSILASESSSQGIDCSNDELNSIV